MFATSLPPSNLFLRLLEWSPLTAAYYVSVAHLRCALHYNYPGQYQHLGAQ